VGGDVSGLTHGGVNMAGLRADPAARAGLEVQPHGFVQFASKQFQQLIAGLWVHD